jgi:hypothetical protein
MVEIDIWVLRDQSWRDVDVVGFDVEALDGKVGEVDEATYDVRRGRIVVDTGLPIVGKKVILPAGTIERIDEDEKKVYVAITKDEIKSAPEYDDENLDSFERYYRDRSGSARSGLKGCLRQAVRSATLRGP